MRRKKSRIEALRIRPRECVINILGQMRLGNADAIVERTGIGDVCHT